MPELSAFVVTMPGMVVRDFSTSCSPIDSFDGREDSPAGREGGDDNFFQVVLFVAQGNDERSVAFVELVSFFFIVDVRKFQRARNGTF